MRAYEPPWYENLRHMEKFLALINDRKGPYKLVGINEKGLEFILDAYPTKIAARTALLEFLEVLWMNNSQELYSARVIDSEGQTIYNGAKFMPNEDEYKIVAMPEIWMGIKAWLAEKDNKQYVLITALDRLVAVPLEYEILEENKEVVLIFRKSGEDVEFDIVLKEDLNEALLYAREYVNESRGAWDEIIVMSDIASVYEVITKVNEESEKISWLKMSKLPVEDLSSEYKSLGTYREFYIKLENGLKLRQYKYV